MKKLNYIFFLGIFLVLLTISFANAELCKGSDGYWRGCSGKSSSGYSTYNQMSKSSMYDSPYSSSYSNYKNVGYNYQNKYGVRKDHKKTVGSYYAINYDFDYRNEYNQEYYGFDNFRYYDNGYDHEYKYGYNTYEKGYVKYSYEEKYGYEETHKYSRGY